MKNANSNVIVLFLVVLAAFFLLSSNAHSYEAFIKVHNDNFYSAKMHGRPLWLVMERVDNNNIQAWRRYAQVQGNSRAVQFGRDMRDEDGKLLLPTFTGGGSGHFAMVLENGDYEKNEIWIAYVTSNNSPAPASSELLNYGASNLDIKNDPNGGHKFAKDIHMFVTVTSSPQALLTSHFGVSSSIEGIRMNQRGISMDLHSFAAKVMLMRNPLRKYMLTSPTFPMESIFAQSLPEGSIFVGSRELANIVEERSRVPFDKYVESLAPDEKENPLWNKAIDDAAILNRAIKALPQGPDHAEQNMKDFAALLYEYGKYLAYDKSINEFIPSSPLIDEAYKKLLQSQYKEWKNVLSLFGFKGVENFPELIAKYPPLLSVDGANGNRINNYFTIFDKNDPKNPWLVVNRALTPGYNWVFLEPYMPAGQTHYVLINLKNLAENKLLEENP